jgi:cysteine desulfurase
VNISKLSRDISVAGQLSPGDLSLIQSLGFRSVVCNRPDGESIDQPLFRSIADAAKLSNVAAHYMPVSGSPGPDQISALRQLWPQLQKPVLFYCRSGARSAALVQKSLTVGQV